MNRYAVAFNYEKIPKHNKTEVNENIVQFYLDDALVFSYRLIPGSITTFEQALGLDIVEAEDEKRAMMKVKDYLPFMIREMTVLEVPINEKELPTCSEKETDNK